MNKNKIKRERLLPDSDTLFNQFTYKSRLKFRFLKKRFSFL